MSSLHRRGAHLHTSFLIVTVFLVAAIEVVEMVTIVLGVGVARGWGATLIGVAVGFAVLAAIIAGLGVALTRIPINILRTLVGILLLLFGLQWLRRPIFNLSLHGLQRGIHEEEDETDRAAPGRFDWTAFALSFKGVLLEGLEVAFIVVTFGAANHQLGLSIIGAAASFVIVGLTGAFVGSLLRNVPASVLKFAVGLLLVSYGTFWGAEGLGVKWPLGDLAILIILALYAALSLAAVALLRRALVPERSIGRASGAA